MLPMLAIGGSGVISVWNNIAPRQVHDLCESFWKGDLATAQELQRAGIPLINALFSEVNPIPVKEAMNMMGMEVGPVRAPLCEMSEANKAKMAKIMEAYGLKLI